MIKTGSLRWFSPNATGDEAVRLATGRVEVLELLADEEDLADEDAPMHPAYRVRNIDNGREAVAFGDELSTT